MGGCLSRGGGADGDTVQARGVPGSVGAAGASPSPWSCTGRRPAPSDGYGFDPSVATTDASYDFDYAAYAASLLAKGGSVGGSSEARRRRFRRHRDRPPHTTAAGGGSSSSFSMAGGSSPVNGSSFTGPSSPPRDTRPPTAFGPRPDLSRPLAQSLLGRETPDDVAALYPPTGVVLGRGQFGVAREATSARTGERVAVKTIPKRALRGAAAECPGLVDVRREVEVLRHLSPHPRIVRLVDALEDDHAVHLVLELCEGGELVDAVAAEGRFTERDAAAAARALLEAVAYCHELGVAHRDLKLDNLLIGSCFPPPSAAAPPSSSASSGGGKGGKSVTKGGGCLTPALSLSDRIAAVKANDFGLAAFVRDGERVHDLCGTAFYVAPEVLECCSPNGGGKACSRGYDAKRADIWAAGVILYIMLSGTPPFYAERDEDVFRQILQGGDDGRGPSFGGRVWDSVSTPAIECVQRMMQRDPLRRPTAAELLRDDPWIRVGGVASDDRPLQPEVLRRMHAFSRQNRLRREAMLLVAESMPPEEIAGLRALFDDFDADGDGLVTADELREGLLRKVGGGHGAAAASSAILPAEAIARVVALADVDRDARLSVDEFVASTLDICRWGLRRRLEAAFARFDRDGDGYATRDEVRAALAALQGRRKLREARSSSRRLGSASSASAGAVNGGGAGGGGDDGRDDTDTLEDDGGGDEAFLEGELTIAERSILNADLDAIFSEADADGDGRISRGEFFAMMERPIDAAEGGLGDGGGGSEGDGGACRRGSGFAGGINRRSLAAAVRAVEKQRLQQQQQQQPGADPPPLPVRALA